MTTLIIDTADDPRPKLAALKAAGIRTIIGYLSSINPTGAKCWTPARMRALAAAGLRAGLVHEGWGGVDGRGISAADGARDGRYCRTAGIALGAPRGTCVYFACDWDFTPAQIAASVIPYFKAIRAEFADGFYRVGVYGSGAVCAAVIGAGLADLSWIAQSRGWLGYSAWLARADMRQGPETRIAGLDVDTDTAQGDIGDFVPYCRGGDAAPPAAPDRSVRALQSALNALGADPPLQLDGIAGDATRSAIKSFQVFAGIEADGIAGDETWSAIEEKLKAAPTAPVRVVSSAKDYQIGAAALTKVLDDYIAAHVPSFLQAEFAAKVPELSGAGARAVIDAVKSSHAT
jgi:hypothetical protein